jgi:DNA-binding response OmpR family regulator
MLPHKIALVDDDAEYAELLAQYIRGLGVVVDVFSDSDDLLTDGDPFGYDFYVVDLTLPGVDGVNLIKVLRRRSEAGVLVVSGRLAADVFKEVVGAGADMYLAKPVQFEQVAVALRAVYRRTGKTSATQVEWKLDRRAGQLVAPDGVRVDLSETDQTLLECFVEARGEVVSRETLRHQLGGPVDGDAAGGLNAMIYRLRRRIERATPIVVPLQSKSRIGYVFRAPLQGI